MVEPRISTVSQFFMIQVDGAVPRSPMPPVRIGAVIGQYRLAQERQSVGECGDLVTRGQGALANQDGNTAAGI